MSSVSGGGFGSGAGSVNSRNLNTNIRTDGAFQLHPEVAAPKNTPSTEGVKQVDSQVKSQQTKDVQPTVVKSLSTGDIYKQLADINKLTSLNKQLGLLMAAHGVEISEDSLDLVNKLLKGKKSKAAQESAILLVSKGLGGAVDDVDILANMLNKNANITKSLNNLGQMQSKMMSFLSDQFKNNPAMQSFVSIFDDFNDQLKKLKKINSGNLLITNQSELMDDILSMTTVLKGMMSKFNLNNKLFATYLKELNNLNKNFLGQIILSQDSVKQPLGLLESYHYFQIPNPLSAQAFIEMLLRKQTNKVNDKKQKKDDELKQEKIIISMDSESMGKVTVIIVIMGFKVWCTMYSDKESGVSHINSFRNELSENLKKLQFKLEDFKTARKKINIHKFIAPSQDISDVKRVQTEI